MANRDNQTLRPDEDINQVSASSPPLRGIGNVWYGRNDQVGWFFEVTNSLGEFVEYVDEINYSLDREQLKQLVLINTGVELDNADLLDAEQTVQRWW